MRRSARSAKPKYFIQEAEGSDFAEEDGFDDELDDTDNSGDEWQPERKKRKKGNRGRDDGQESDTDEDEDEEAALLAADDDEEDELVMMARESNSEPSRKKKRSKTNRNGSTVPTKAVPPSRAGVISNTVTDEDILAAQAAIEMDEEEERQEQEAAAKEAAEMWDQVRKRKQEKLAAKQPKPVAAKLPIDGPPSLSSWLNIPEPDWPTTCADAMINDRDSLFVGFVYSLSTPSQSTISQLLAHLAKTVHPKAVPSNRLPPGMQHLAANRRGASHDMQAWRCLALKRGRSGLNGPEDFGLEEGQEDDGERFGANAIAKVIKQLGATDVLVVVSRWYGGTMLGPVRFQHIENCARAALGQYMINEALVPLKKQLYELDEQMGSLRSQLGSTSSFIKPQYDDLDLEKIERLIGARKKAIEMMKKRLAPKEASQDQAKAEVAAHVELKDNEPAPVEAATVGDSVTEPDGADLTGWDALE